jgi:hypothetical protein
MYGWLEIVGGVGGGLLCLLAFFVLNPDSVSRATEAVLDRVEVRLALRRQRRLRASRAERGVSLSLLETWQRKSG